MTTPVPTTPANAAALRWHRVAVATVAALILVDVLWELWLAPLKPGGSWLALKALPLALLWPAFARGAKRAAQWLALLLPLYLIESITRAYSESGRHAAIASAATLLIIVAFATLLATFRLQRSPS
jgi:uncharacterized membrane protein